MFPVKRKVEEAIDTSLYCRIYNAIVLVLIYGLISYFGMPTLIAYVEKLDSIFALNDSLPFSFGSIFFCITLLVSMSSVIPTYRLMLIKEIETPNPFISWSKL